MHQPGMQSKHKQTYKLCQSLGGVNIAKVLVYISNVLSYFDPPAAGLESGATHGRTMMSLTAWMTSFAA